LLAMELSSGAIGLPEVRAQPAAQVNRPPVTGLHHARCSTPLSRAELAVIDKAHRAYGGCRTTVIALRLMLRTFVRTKELAVAPWAEFGIMWKVFAGASSSPPS